MEEIEEYDRFGLVCCLLSTYIIISLSFTFPLYVTFNDPFFGTIFKIFSSSYLLIEMFCLLGNKKIRIIGALIGISFCVIVIICLIYGIDWYLNHFKKYDSLILIGIINPSLISIPSPEIFVMIIDGIMIEVRIGFGDLIYCFIFTIGGLIILIVLNFHIERKISEVYAKSDRTIKSLIKLADSNKDTDKISLKDKLVPKVHLGEEFLVPSKPIICISCGSTNPKESRICKFCHVRLQICAICERTISMEDLVYCLYCNTTYHKSEFLEWLKIKAHCKNCARELDLWEFQKFLAEYGVIEKKSSKLCTNCKKLIPNDSYFCIFCGIKVKNH